MRRICKIIFLMIIAITLFGCSSFTCDLCSEEKTGKKHTSEIFGEKITICEDCYKDVQNLFGN